MPILLPSALYARLCDSHGMPGLFHAVWRVLTFKEGYLFKRLHQRLFCHSSLCAASFFSRKVFSSFFFECHYGDAPFRNGRPIFGWAGFGPNSSLTSANAYQINAFRLLSQNGCSTSWKLPSFRDSFSRNNHGCL